MRGALPIIQTIFDTFSHNGYPQMRGQSTLGAQLQQQPFVAPHIPSPANKLPTSGNALWYTSPASNTSTWSTEWLPIGNGYLGSMISGGPALDYIQINIESLWSGGPFFNSSYTGGNHPESDAPALAKALTDIRSGIFSSASGNGASVSPLTYPANDYGSFSGGGYVTVNRTVAKGAKTSDYLRWLDLDSGLLKESWVEGKDTQLDREAFCSYPTKSCSYYTKTSSRSGDSASYSFLPLVGLTSPISTCLDNSTLQYRGQAENGGMAYEFLLRAQTVPENRVRCGTIGNSKTLTLTTTNATESWITWVGGTNYNINAGTPETGFTFKGPDPHSALVKDLTLATSKALTYAKFKAVHLLDYSKGLTSRFSLDLGQKPDFTRSTWEQVEAYVTEKGNVHLEWVLFNYGRYMLFTSARGVLPTNLQGVWARDTGAPWSGDYHANINTQMNYWPAEVTDIDVTASLWDYMEKTWIPRGEQTAQILYNSSRGWVTHNEMNIFGHTGMKAYETYDTSLWANYPASAAWMMTHVFDHLDYGLGTAEWWKAQGWPLVKGVAEFWLENLFADTHSKDGTMVVNPCNSPEQPPITLGCAHYQQLVWELFNGIEKNYVLAGEQDAQFLRDIRAKKARLDRGLHIGSWGQLQEWKIDQDGQSDTHRHLSHLYGLYPGYAIASYPEGGQVVGVSKTALLDATRTSLEHRGNGTGPDGDAGWEKVWRAACWAQFGEGERFYTQFKYAVERNFGYNLFSLYNPFSYDPIFQIDANLGVPGAVMNALLQAPDTSSLSSPLVLTILPALPSAWATKGSLKGARARGGISVSFSWKDGKAQDIILKFDRARQARTVQVYVGKKFVQTFVGKPGMVKEIKV